MEIVNFKDIAEFGQFYRTVAAENDAVTAVLFYEEAQELLRWLLRDKDIYVWYIDFGCEEAGYSKEYYVTLHMDSVIEVKPAAIDKEYQIEKTDVLFLDGDASARIAHINEDCVQLELEFNKKDIDKDKTEVDDEYYKTFINLIDICPDGVLFEIIKRL